MIFLGLKSNHGIMDDFGDSSQTDYFAVFHSWMGINEPLFDILFIVFKQKKKE